MTAAQTLLWLAAGQPPVAGAKGKLLQEHPAVCCITGEHCEITADSRKALGENFTDHSLWAAPTGRVGQAALWCCSGVGKQSPRTWTWLCAPGEQLPDSHEKALYNPPELCLTNRANTRPVIQMLLNPPARQWVVAVSISGQKHVLPYAQTNQGTGVWTIRMEDQNITATPEVFSLVFFTVLALRRMGISAENIKNGQPGWLKTHEDAQQWRVLSEKLRPYQTAPITELALWCITKPILEDINAYPNR